MSRLGLSLHTTYFHLLEVLVVECTRCLFCRSQELLVLACELTIVRQALDVDRCTLWVGKVDPFTFFGICDWLIWRRLKC